MSQEQLQKIFKLIEVLALVVLVICVIILVTQNMKLQKIKNQEIQNEQTLIELQEKIDELNEELEYRQSDDYLIEWAIDNGLIKPGDELYRGQ